MNVGAIIAIIYMVQQHLLLLFLKIWLFGKGRGIWGGLRLLPLRFPVLFRIAEDFRHIAGGCEHSCTIASSFALTAGITFFKQAMRNFVASTVQ